MSRAAAFVSRYRWELTPLVAMAVARLAATLAAPIFGNPQLARPALTLLVAAVLAVMLPRVQREGRPLLTALWLLLLVPSMAGAAGNLVATLWDDSLRPTQLGLLYTVSAIPGGLAALTICAWQARRGMRFAMLLGATYLAPTHFLGFVGFILAAIGHGRPENVSLPAFVLPWTSLVVSPLAVVAVALIAHALHHAEAMEPRALSRRILLLLSCAVVSLAAAYASPAVMGSIQGGEWLTAIGWVFLAPLMALAQVVVLLGLVWLLARLVIIARPKVVANE